MVLDTLQRVMNRLDQSLDPRLTYHNSAHTRDVFDAVGRIADYEGLTGTQKESLQLAAAYHDIGFLQTSNGVGHEQASVELFMTDFPELNNSDKELVSALILATGMPHNPQSTLQEIMCDADLDYLGRKDYFDLAEGLYLEYLAFGKLKDRQEWKELQIAFFESHRYFTKFGQIERQPGKLNNLEQIKARTTLHY